MSLQVYNSLSRKKELFHSLEAGKVKMYCCGPTVYDFLHVGNFRGPVFFNFVRNWLEHTGYQVFYAFNFTDIDDKILKRAKDEGEDPRIIAETYIKEFWTDFNCLALKKHDANPRVTEHVEDIIAFIAGLIEKGHAYAVDGNVYFSVKSKADYGKLSGRSIEDQLTGVRVDLEPDKKDPQDFALWKKAKGSEESWPSPWGRGRPGWHIECSVMIYKHLGMQIDIHGGGSDLKFPHHENEIAQSECFTNQEFARYWMHNSMFTFSGQKMSKSLGNIRSMRSFLQQFHPEIFKFLVLSAHYRSILEFGERTISEAISGLAKIYSTLATAKIILSRQNEEKIEAPKDFMDKVAHFQQSVQESLDDDFNTPGFFVCLYELMHEFNKQLNRNSKIKPSTLGIAQAFTQAVQVYAPLMSLFQEEPEAFLLAMDDLLLKQMAVERTTVQALVDQRYAKRQVKDFAASDQIRDQLLNLGIALQDSPEGTYWEVKK